MQNELNSNIETWKDIVNFESLYQVSNLGRIKSLDKIDSAGKHRREKIMSLVIDCRGYFQINLIKNKKPFHYFIHRLVASAFLNPNIENKRTVNHKDGNKRNNIPSNLEWATDDENIKHAVKLGLINTRGENCPVSKLKNQDILNIRNEFKETKNYKEIALKYNIHTRTVYKLVNKERWKHI